jgi:hypothetical protein
VVRWSEYPAEQFSIVDFQSLIFLEWGIRGEAGESAVGGADFALCGFFSRDGERIALWYDRRLMGGELLPIAFGNWKIRSEAWFYSA